MSEENQVETKSAEDMVVEKFDAIVEEKTVGLVSEEKAAEMVASAVAEVKEASAAELTELKGAIEKLEADVSAPAIIKEGDSKMQFEKQFVDEMGEVFAKKFDVITKRVGDNTDVAGGRVTGQGPYWSMIQADPLRLAATTIPAGGSGVVKLPSIAGISWASEAAQPAASRTPGGTSVSKNVIIETWVSENEYSLANLEDVPSMDAAIAGLMADELQEASADDAVAVLKAATVPSGHSLTTGVASGLPTAANVVGRLTDMVTPLSSRYASGGAYYISRAMYATLKQSNNNGLNYDAAAGVERLNGYPVIVVDQLEAVAAGNLVALFGDMGRGLAHCSSQNMTIGRFDQTRPGSMTYFGRARFKFGQWDENALTRMTVGA